MSTTIQLAEDEPVGEEDPWGDLFGQTANRSPLSRSLIEAESLDPREGVMDVSTSLLPVKGERRRAVERPAESRVGNHVQLARQCDPVPFVKHQLLALDLVASL